MRGERSRGALGSTHLLRLASHLAVVLSRHYLAVGNNVVPVRARINRSKQPWSELPVETASRPMADPSRAERELDGQLPDDHSLQRKPAAVIRRLIDQYGDTESLMGATPDCVRWAR